MCGPSVAWSGFAGLWGTEVPSDLPTGPRSGPDAAVRSLPLRRTALPAAVIIASFLFLGILLYSLQFSGTLRWIVGVFVVMAVTAVAWYEVSRRTARPEPLTRDPPKTSFLEGELANLSALVERANRGMALSQSLLAGRLRDAFAERARLQLGLSPEGFRKLADDEAGLRAALRDDAIADFLRATRDREGREAWVLAARRGAGFDPEFRSLLNRMEAWR